MVEVVERKCMCLEDENSRLREENERLRDELRFLRTEVRDSSSCSRCRCSSRRSEGVGSGDTPVYGSAVQLCNQQHRQTQ